MKKTIILSIIINLITWLLIPIEFFLFNIPRLVGVLFAILAIAADIFYLVKSNSKKSAKIIQTIISIYTALTILFFAICFPYWNSIVFKKHVNTITKPFDYEMTQKQALHDFDYAYKQLNRVHPAMLNKKGDEYKKVQAAYETERNKICGKEKTTVVELQQHVERFLSVLQDGHTYTRAYYGEPRYMKYLDQVNDEDFSFTALNGIPYDELLQQKKDLFSFESEILAKQDLGDYSIYYQYLIYLGYDLDKGITYTLEKADDAGNKITKELTVTKDDFYRLMNIRSTIKNTAKRKMRIPEQKKNPSVIIQLNRNTMLQFLL